MKTKIVLLTILLAGLSAYPSGASQVTTTSYSTSGFTVDTSQDLILGDTPGWSGNVGTTNMAHLADGLAPLSIPGYDGNNILQNGVVVTWDLGAAATINEIQTYSAWPGDRYVQDYTVDVSLDGSTWTNGVVAVVAQGTAAPAGPDNWHNVKVAVTTSDSSPLADNVRYVRFNFPSQPLGNGAVGYQEFVINGASYAIPEAPAFATHPQSQTILNNQNVTFTAGVTGYPIPTIAWHFVDAESFDQLLAATGNTLTFKVNAAKAGHYYAVATNSEGTATSDSALLTVTPTPFTETFDNSGNAFAGMATNNLIAGNAGTSVALNNFDTQGGWTTANLTDGNIGSPTSVNGGTGAYPYTLIGNNGSVTYNLGAPCTITGFESWSSWNGGGRCNQNYSFSYSLDGSTYIPLWTVANNPTPQQPYGNDVALAISTPLTNVVSVRFDFGSQQNGGAAYTELAVYGTPPPPSLPVITAVPQGQAVTNDDSVTFTAAATGYPAPTFAWHFVDASSTDHLLAATGDTLTFKADLTKAGHYYAVASNTQGTATSSPSALLTVAPNAVTTAGGITETDLTFSTTSQSSLPLAANNLIAGNPGTNIALNEYDTQNGWTPANLTDGEVNPPGAIGSGVGVYTIIGNNGTVTYNLGTGANGAGYDITGVRSLTRWTGGGRVQPNYTVSYSLDGTTFTPFATVNYLAPGSSWGTDVALGFSGIAHVKSIKFDFGSQQNSGVSYTELAVFGSSSAWTDPFAAWINGLDWSGFTSPDKSATGDPDGDGMTNQQEYAFGLDPRHGSSANPIAVPLDPATGTFSYTRRATPATTGLAYTVLTSTDLLTWTPDAGSAESITTSGDVQTVTFTVSHTAVNGKLFVRVAAQ